MDYKKMWQELRGDLRARLGICLVEIMNITNQIESEVLHDRHRNLTYWLEKMQSIEKQAKDE